MNCYIITFIFQMFMYNEQLFTTFIFQMCMYNELLFTTFIFQMFMYNELLFYNMKKNDWLKVTAPNSPPPRSAHQVTGVGP